MFPGFASSWQQWAYLGKVECRRKRWIVPKTPRISAIRIFRTCRRWSECSSTFSLKISLLSRETQTNCKCPRNEFISIWNIGGASSSFFTSTPPTSSPKKCLKCSSDGHSLKDCHDASPNEKKNCGRILRRLGPRLVSQESCQETTRRTIKCPARQASWILERFLYSGLGSFGRLTSLWLKESQWT